MTIVVRPCTPADMPRSCTINFDTMAREHPIVNEGFPLHWTMTGRRAALLRYCKPAFFEGDPTLHHLKIIDESLAGKSSVEFGTSGCDPFIGYGRWFVKRRGQDVQILPKQRTASGDWWASERDKRFVEWAGAKYDALRLAKMRDTPIEKSVYCVGVLAVLPGFQGRGAGEAFLRWGIEQADREGADCTVESSLSAEGFYAKHGFEAVEDVAIIPLPEFRDKGIQKYTWMVRKPQSAAP